MDLLKKPLPVGLVVVAAVGLTAYTRVRRTIKRKLALVEKANTKYAPFSHTSSYVPVAIFVGGTSGIGQGMAEAFAKYTKGNAHIILIGRNVTAAHAIIAKFPKPTAAAAKHEFIYCDASLMKDIDRLTGELLARIPKINFLVLSTMEFASLGREDTQEGVDSKMALAYYGRVKFTTSLAPALQMARKGGEDATVHYVAAPGRGKPINWEDLSMKKSYAIRSVPSYLDTILQELAPRHRNFTFIHAWPGLVRTGLVRDAPLPYRLYFNLMATINPWALSHTESGEFMVRAMWQTADRPGVWSVDEYGDKLPEGSVRVASEEERSKLWEHTVEVTSLKSA
ncbi:hypothetical protein D9757_009972 [Collybiopsis confluens]|uniref:NAD(P)-binding protein n=1 Tax=Collybiopsis confluens TaxID=2823264 RepID=A0A8H5CPJ5_9AGAR|nr:hypothetical protein D9757_013517 [Collybiopsis confluens]KAF5371453.1 hypothetical protein D9757_009972 [Collybiopsis confluens]